MCFNLFGEIRQFQRNKLHIRGKIATISSITLNIPIKTNSLSGEFHLPPQPRRVLRIHTRRGIFFCRGRFFSRSVGFAERSESVAFRRAGR
jgi:hypothetical protein